VKDPASQEEGDAGKEDGEDEHDLIDVSGVYTNVRIREGFFLPLV
jgi:hypothetical protein